MKLTSQDILKSYFETYKELEELLKLDLETILKDKIYLRSLERLVSIITINIKRLQKLNPLWEIPHYKTILKVKKQITWDFAEIKPAYWRHFLFSILPKINSYLLEKENSQTSKNEK